MGGIARTIWVDAQLRVEARGHKRRGEGALQARLAHGPSATAAEHGAIGQCDAAPPKAVAALVAKGAEADACRGRL